MKTLLYKSIVCLMVLAPLTLSAGKDKLGGKYTKEKTIKKEFAVNSNALLKISNSYGNLNLTSWNEDRIVIEVQIKTNGNNEERVQERLNEIDVDFHSMNVFFYCEPSIHSTTEDCRGSVPCESLGRFVSPELRYSVHRSLVIIV